MQIVVLYIFWLSTTAISTVSSFSCHTCTSMDLYSLSKNDAIRYNTDVDRCVDYEGQEQCLTDMRSGKCDQVTLEMKAQCNKTCDLCRFKSSGELQQYDLDYWNFQTDLTDLFEVVNVSMVFSESSSVRDNKYSEYGPNNSIDGNLTSFVWTKYESEPYVVVALGATLSVKYVYIINRWGSGAMRNNLLSINDAMVTALLLPPGGSVGNATSCGQIEVQEGLELTQQTYKIACEGSPMSTHVKIHRSDYGYLELTEIIVGVVDRRNECRNTMTRKCDDYLNSDKCLKMQYSGIWHGKKVVYSERSCYYPTLANSTNCTLLLNAQNKRWAHLQSGYEIVGAYDPNAFQLTTCNQYVCDGADCNGSQRVLLSVLYWIALLFTVLQCWIV